MPVQVNIFLLLFGALQGIFLSAVLLQKKVHKTGYGLLVLYLAIVVLQMTLKVMSKIWLLDNMHSLYNYSYYFPLLYGPLLFLFTQRYFSEKKFRAYDYLHFLPFGFIIILPAFDGQDYQPSYVGEIFFHPFTWLVFELCSVIIYHILAYHNWRQYQSDVKEKLSQAGNLRSNWIRQFILVSFIVCLLISVVLYCMFIWYPYQQEIRFGFIGLSVFVYWISYSAWNQPQLFSSTEQYIETRKVASMAPTLTFYSATKKYSNSGLSTEEEHRIITRLDELLERQKLFLQPDITIDKLAAYIGCSKHHLSQVLNACIQKSFYDHINFYRVEEAKILLADETLSNHKIASIAYDAGFNSLSTFNEVFKKITGLTPSQYRKQPVVLARKQRV